MSLKRRVLKLVERSNTGEAADLRKHWERRFDERKAVVTRTSHRSAMVARRSHGAGACPVGGVARWARVDSKAGSGSADRSASKLHSAHPIPPAIIT